MTDIGQNVIETYRRQAAPPGLEAAIVTNHHRARPRLSHVRLVTTAAVLFIAVLLVAMSVVNVTQKITDVAKLSATSFTPRTITIPTFAHGTMPTVAAFSGLGNVRYTEQQLIRLAAMKQRMNAAINRSKSIL